MGGPAKIKLSCCLLSNVFGNAFWKDFEVELEPILGANWRSESTWKAGMVSNAKESVARFSRTDQN